MPDTFALTIIFIVLCTLVGAFIKGRTKDTCLKSFDGFPVILKKNDGKTVCGNLCVENSGLELVYSEPYFDEKDKQAETSYILYKNEYGQIGSLVRYVDDLSQELVKAREKDFRKTRHPGWARRLGRKIKNVFGTIRDSILEVANLLMGRIKTASPAANILKGQDKYVSQIQQQAITTLGASYEPILERYVGKKIVVAVMRDGEKTEYTGIFKDYTTEFIEIMDIQFALEGDETPRKADMVIPRALGTVRHSGE